MSPPIKLSKNFNSAEFACRHCGQFQVDARLVQALQELRDIAGRPVHPTNVYRCPEHNDAVGGEKNSLHVLGRAADFIVVGLSVVQTYELTKLVKAFAESGIGVYIGEGFVHADVGRPKPARWGRIKAGG